MWISYLRGQRNVQLWTARSETRNERRRRVAAETAQRMQAMARALTTAADPAQVADAVFAALRDELQVDAATFALLDERGGCARCGASATTPDEPIDGVLTSLQPDDPVLGENVAFFAEIASTTCGGSGPTSTASLSSDRFRALAIIPLVVSDRTIGAVVVHWDDDRDISGPDRTFLFTITGTAAQAVERARLDADRVRQPRAQPASAPAQLGAGRRHDAGRRGPCGHRRRPAGPGCAVRGRTRTRRRTSERWPAWPAAGTRLCFPARMVPARREPRRAVLHARPDRPRHASRRGRGAERTWPPRSCPGCCATFPAGDDRQRAARSAASARSGCSRSPSSPSPS